MIELLHDFFLMTYDNLIGYILMFYTPVSY